MVIIRVSNPRSPITEIAVREGQSISVRDLILNRGILWNPAGFYYGVINHTPPNQNFNGSKLFHVCDDLWVRPCHNLEMVLKSGDIFVVSPRCIFQPTNCGMSRKEVSSSTVRESLICVQ
jgi:hypothetical protein